MKYEIWYTYLDGEKSKQATFRYRDEAEMYLEMITQLQSNRPKERYELIIAEIPEREECKIFR